MSKYLNALSQSLNRLIRDCLQKLAGEGDPESLIEEFERLSGTGNSHGQRFNRDEAHERSWPESVPLERPRRSTGTADRSGVRLIN